MRIPHIVRDSLTSPETLVHFYEVDLISFEVVTPILKDPTGFPQAARLSAKYSHSDRSQMTDVTRLMRSRPSSQSVKSLFDESFHGFLDSL